MQNKSEKGEDREKIITRKYQNLSNINKNKNNIYDDKYNNDSNIMIMIMIIKKWW